MQLKRDSHYFYMNGGARRISRHEMDLDPERMVEYVLDLYGYRAAFSLYESWHADLKDLQGLPAVKRWRLSQRLLSKLWKACPWGLGAELLEYTHGSTRRAR